MATLLRLISIKASFSSSTFGDHGVHGVYKGFLNSRHGTSNTKNRWKLLVWLVKTMITNGDSLFRNIGFHGSMYVAKMGSPNKYTKYLVIHTQ